jgi:hypothetical protein
MRSIKQNKLSAINDPRANAILESRVMLATPDESATLSAYETQNINGLVAQNNPWGIQANHPNQKNKLLNLESKVESAFDGRGARITITKNLVDSTRPDRPNGFPSIFIGKNYNTSPRNPFGNSGLKQNEIVEIPFTFNSNGGSIEGVYNNTIDIWFGGTNEKANQFLMLQNYNSAIETTDKPKTDPEPGLGQPAGVNPYCLFDNDGTKFEPHELEAMRLRQNQTVQGLPGRYDIWAGGSGNQDGKSTVSYVRRDAKGRQNTQGDLNMLIRDAQKRGLIDADNNVTNVFAGTEIWSGGVGIFNELEIDAKRTTLDSASPSETTESTSDQNERIANQDQPANAPQPSPPKSP